MYVRGIFYLAAGIVLATTGLMNVGENAGLSLLFIGTILILCGTFIIGARMKK